MEPISDDIDWAMVAAAREPHPVEDERKAGRKAADAAYYRRNRQRIDSRNRAWRRANRELMREYDRHYADTHRESRREASRRWHARFRAEHGVSYSTWRRQALRNAERGLVEPSGD